MNMIIARIESALENIEQLYRSWSELMEKKTDFWKTGKDWHTKSHCSRVLLLVLIIGKLKNLHTAELNALAAAAVFHDSRRMDDWPDVGHRQRAADYYRTCCKNMVTAYDARVYYVMAYHDREDETGWQILREKFPDDQTAVLLYQIFKDADALDRFRLGPDALDARYLRTTEAKELVDFSKVLLQYGPEVILKKRSVAFFYPCLYSKSCSPFCALRSGCTRCRSPSISQALRYPHEWPEPW